MVVRGSRERPTIYVHFGAHKTGSTSIQKNFARHRAVLKQNGLRYIGPNGPYKHLFSAFLKDPTTFFWNQLSGLSKEELILRDQEVLADLARRIRQTKESKILISNEFLSHLGVEKLEALHKFFFQFGKVHAVYFYRELEAWLNSNTQELAKSGIATAPTPLQHGLDQLSVFPRRIVSVFGEQNCSFVKFEDAVRIGVCNAALRTLGIDDFDALELDETRENTGVSGPAVRALLKYNRRFPAGHEARDAAYVERLKQLQGPRFQSFGFTPRQIRQYDRARASVLNLGLDLPPAETLSKAGLWARMKRTAGLW